MRALRGADPGQPLSWVEAPMKPATMATTRLAEHWAHGLDITGPLDIPFPDTDRLRHIAWLAHRTLPYAFARAGLGAQDVRCDLTAPDGVTSWEFGPDTAGSAIGGPAGDFCRVAAQRLPPEGSGLRPAARTERPRCGCCAPTPRDAPLPGPVGPGPRDGGTGPEAAGGFRGVAPPGQHCHTWPVSRVEGG